MCPPWTAFIDPHVPCSAPYTSVGYIFTYPTGERLLAVSEECGSYKVTKMYAQGFHINSCYCWKPSQKQTVKGILDIILWPKANVKVPEPSRFHQFFTLPSVYRLFSSHCWRETNIVSFALICGQLGFPILAQWWHLRRKGIKLFSFQPFKHDKDFKNCSGQRWIWM